MSIAAVLLVNGLTVLCVLSALWALSVAIKDVSIIDIAWGASFVLIAWVTRFTADGYEPRQNLLVALTTIWGLRLAFYLAWRNLGHGEDPRYVAMRRRNGEGWWWKSLFKVFWFQGAMAWVVSLPVQLGQIPDEKGAFVILGTVGSIVWLVGIAFEATGDYQLARFKADPANEGKILDEGLWRYTRHPNYFGDSVVWWGLFLIAASTPLGLIGVIGPVVMTYLLINVTGAALLERRMSKKRPAFEAYVAKTSGFFPRPPREPEASSTRSGTS